MGKAAERRQQLRNALVRTAERTVRRKGLAALKARELAAEVGCALGAIYNVFPDLDALILVVNSRTLAAFQRYLARLDSREGAAQRPGDHPAVARLMRLATAYFDFAVANQPRWRALFEHRMGGIGKVPSWYIEAQKPLFALLEEPLSKLRPELGQEQKVLLARNVFAAIHGIVDLGLNQKLAATPAPILRAQVGQIAAAIGAGLLAEAPATASLAGSDPALSHRRSAGRMS
ncbi:MAG TPA: TetR/AcrR family transcriptional regulator [Propylenella sp.]